MALQSYYPELNQAAPESAKTLRASMAHYGKHYFVYSKDELPGGRGVEFLGRTKAENLTPQAQYRVGWYEYKMTLKAFDKLCVQRNVSYETLLD